MNKYRFLAIPIAGGLLASCAATTSNENRADVETRARQILSTMTVEEKVGQIIQADISAVTPADVRKYNLGAVLNGGNSAPGGGKVADPEEWLALADAFWTASTDTSDGGAGIPLLWGTDAVHGHSNLQNATIFPHNSGLGATRDPSLLREIGEVTAREVRATGIDWTFAPTLAVTRDDRWGRTYESYSENPRHVAAYAGAMIEGLQGRPDSGGFLRGDKVIATAKHFVGDGGTQMGIDKGDTIGALHDILRIHGAAYLPAIEAGVQTVMASFSSVNGKKLHGSKRLLTDVLRGEMGFDGFVVGDWNGHAEVPGCTATDCLAALNAGIDMFMAPDSWRGLYDSLLTHADSGTLSMDRLDQAVLRILKVKIRAGLLEAGRPSSRPGANLELLGAPEHREVARRAVRKSLVLLKNQGPILPLRPQQTVLVAGSGADSMKQQTGGWTLSWQGDNNSNSDFQTGETIFAGIKKAVTAQGGTAILSTDGSYSEKPDAAIVVFGEEPYAEFHGDRPDVVFEFGDGSNLALLRKLKRAGVPVVSVFLTGRPLWVNPHLNASDAFVVAWLPGTEGGGVADVLIADESGEPRNDFEGRLSFSWPVNGTGSPINDTDAPKVLFPYGHGLSYGNSQWTGPLPEDPGVPNAGNVFNGGIVHLGNALVPFSLFLGDSSNANVPAEPMGSTSLGGAIKTSGVDYRAQEDARQVRWTGQGEASISARASRPLDLSKFGTPKHMAIRFEWRLDQPPEGPVHLAMKCGEGCGATLDISDLVSGLPEGSWVTTTVPVACFLKKGLDPSKVDTIFELTSNASAVISLHAVTVDKRGESLNGCPG